MGKAVQYEERERHEESQPLRGMQPLRESSRHEESNRARRSSCEISGNALRRLAVENVGEGHRPFPGSPGGTDGNALAFTHHEKRN